MFQKKWPVWIVLTIIITGSLFFLFNHQESISQTPLQKKVRIGVYDGEASLLTILAKEQGFFKAAGLDVELKYYSSGRNAMAGMLKGEVDYANCTEFVVVKNSFENTEYRILASIARCIIMGLVGKKSSGIHKIEDLRGRNIATTVGSSTEYYLGIMLSQQNLSMKNIILENRSPKELKTDMLSGKSDVIFTWEPHLFELEQKLGDEIKTFRMPTGFAFYFLLVANEDFHTQYPAISFNILEALKESETWLWQNKADMKDILNETFHFDPAYVDYSVELHQFELSLPYSLPIAMENEARWLIEQNRVPGNVYTDFIKLFDIAPMKELKPESVTIIE